MKVLNIAALTKPKRVLTGLGDGKRHEVKELTAQQFVDSLAKSEALEARGQDATPREIFLDNVSLVLELAPSVEREVLLKLPLEAVITILKFCRGDDEGIATTEEAAGEGTDAPKVD